METVSQIFLICYFEIAYVYRFIVSDFDAVFNIFSWGSPGILAVVISDLLGETFILMQ